MFMTSDKIGLRAGDVLARENARALATRNMHGCGEAVEATGIEALLREIEALGVPDDAPEPVEAKPRHIDKVPPFQTEGLHPQVLDALEMVREWTRCIIRRACTPHSLSLLGVSGCGKTHMARLARAALLDAGVKCQLWRWGDVLDAVRQGNKGDFLRQIDRMRVLVIDDIGAENFGSTRAVDFSLTELGRLLDTRAGRWTLLTSNLLLRQLGELDARCASRMLRNGGRVAELDLAEDWAVAQYMKNKKH